MVKIGLKATDEKLFENVNGQIKDSLTKYCMYYYLSRKQARNLPCGYVMTAIHIKAQTKHFSANHEK